MYLSSRWAGPRLRAVVRLVLGAVLGVVALIPDFLDLDAAAAGPFRWATAVLSVILLAEAIALLIAGRMHASAWREVLPTAVLLGAVTITSFNLLGVWSGEIAVVGLIAFYVVELRIVVPSRPALYAALVIFGVVGVASLAMADSEAAAEDAQIRNAGDSMMWAFAQIFRAGVLVDVKPVTTTGQFLGFIVIAAGVFFAAVIFSAVTAWAVREQYGAPSEIRIREQVLEALREAGLAVPATTPAPDDSSMRVLLDVDDIVGRLPRTWLLPRGDAVDNFLDEAAAMKLRTDRSVMAVIDADSSADTEGRHPAALAIFVAPEESGDWLVTHLRKDDLVVSGNRRVVQTAEDRGARVVPTAEWRSSIRVDHATA